MPVDRPVRAVLLIGVVGLAYASFAASVLSAGRSRAAGAIAQTALVEFLESVNHTLDEASVSALEGADPGEVAEMCSLDAARYAVRVTLLYYDGSDWVEFSSFGAGGIPAMQSSTAQGYAAWTGTGRSPIVLVRVTVGVRGGEG